VLSSVQRNSPAVTRRNEASLAGMEPIADSRPIPKHLKRTYARKRLKSCERDAYTGKGQGPTLPRSRFSSRAQRCLGRVHDARLVEEAVGDRGEVETDDGQA